MALAPFGVLNEAQRQDLVGGKTLFKPMPDWRGREDAYETLLQGWLDDVTEAFWPAWEDGAWVGRAVDTMEDDTKTELTLAVQLYHGGGQQLGILAEVPVTPTPPDGVARDHLWHYSIEDALVHDNQYRHWQLPEGEEASYDYVASNNIGSNFVVYDPTFPIKEFEDLFWGRMDRLEPSSFAIKMHLQRPRPWTAAVGLGVDGFRYYVAGGFFATHTGVHPSLLSGHCIQGILGGCAVFEALRNAGRPVSAATVSAIQQYMVDWGDRRVFAGVHYMTDNIGSWTLARRLIPHLFQRADEVEAFAMEAITARSRVFQDIVTHFPDSSPAKAVLLKDFPAGAPAV